MAVPMRILDAHLSLFDTQATRQDVLTQLKNVSTQSLNRKVLVDAANHPSARLEHHRVIRGVGNRPTPEVIRRQPRDSAAPPPSR